MDFIELSPKFLRVNELKILNRKARQSFGEEIKMRNGICVKCSAKTVYFSNAKGVHNGLKTGDGGPYLNIYKDNKWIPDIDFLEMSYYVCQTCGYFEMYARDLDALTKLDDCDNWKKVETS